MSMSIRGAVSPIFHSNFLQIGMNAAKIGKLTSSVVISTIAMKALSSIQQAKAGPLDDPYVRCILECDKLTTDPNGDSRLTFLCQAGCFIADLFRTK